MEEEEKSIYIFHRYGPQKVSTKKVHRKCQQKVSTKSVHKNCPQKVSTKSVHKKCAQNVSTKKFQKSVFKKLPHKAEGERKVSGRGVDGEQQGRSR